MIFYNNLMSKSITHKRLKQAEETLEEAVFLMENGFTPAHIATKLYHTMLYCVFALFGIHDLQNLSHAELIEMFKSRFVNNGLFPAHYFNALYRGYQLTHQCGCTERVDPSKEEIENMYNAAKEFLQTTRDHLSS